MEIDILDNEMGHMEDESVEVLLSSCTSTDEIFGDQQMLPRVGDEYQAELPPLIAECQRLALVNKLSDAEVLESFPLGLPIPLMWLTSEVKNVGVVKLEKSEKNQIISYNELLDRGFFPLPGSLGASWEEIERDSFLLGLYIFGKNLVYVQKFVDSKTMGDVLFFYYGKFYRSDGYCRWAECRKLRSKRSINGQKLFSGWRQHELLSRLSSLVTKECQDTLLEVTKILSEGKITYEEYAFALKDTVGISAFVEAIGIGKGKQDLTGTGMEPAKPNHVNSVRPEIPVGKACSSLSSADIIKFLTGDFRLSKARSSDLFWEAVWPRLLARGWHSEQPKDHGSKNSLVFLISGVKKFSRRKLVKGSHYFDSVTDVLNKVASDPGLLEIEAEVNKGSGNKEGNDVDATIKQETGEISDKRQRYLKPRSLNSSGVMQFTIVDTSLVQGGRRRVRELRSLPVEATSLCVSNSSDSDEDSSDDSDSDIEETSTSNSTKHIADMEMCIDADSSECVNSAPDVGIPNASSIAPLENHESHTKQRDLADCVNGESSCSIDNNFADRMLNDNGSRCRSSSPDIARVGHSVLSPATSLARGSPEASRGGIATEMPGNPRPQLIDLNIPQVMDFEADEPIKAITTVTYTNKSSIHPEPSETREENPGVNNRRQSTRNRPLTTKALEALECGFLSPKKNKKRAMEGSLKNSRRVRSRPVVSNSFRNGEAAGKSEMEKNLDGMCCTSTSTSIIDQSQI